MSKLTDKIIISVIGIGVFSIVAFLMGYISKNFLTGTMWGLNIIIVLCIIFRNIK